MEGVSDGSSDNEVNNDIQVGRLSIWTAEDERIVGTCVTSVDERKSKEQLKRLIDLLADML